VRYNNMEIKKEKNGGSLHIQLFGRLDTVTAPQFEASLKEDLDSLTELIIDFQTLEYVSSAGLRVLLMAQKQMNKQGKMKIINVSEPIKEVFDMTGFSDILTIE